MLNSKKVPQLATVIKEARFITAYDFAAIKRYYINEEVMRKIPGSSQANARYIVVLEQWEIKFEEMIECKKQLAELQRCKRTSEGLELYKQQLVKLEQAEQRFTKAIEEQENLINLEDNQKLTGIAYYKHKFGILMHKKQHEIDLAENRKKLEELEQNNKHLLKIQKEKKWHEEKIDEKQKFVTRETYKANLLKLENNKVNFVETIKTYNEWREEVVGELRGCLTQNQLYTLFKYFHNNMAFSDSYALYIKKMQLTNPNTQFCNETNDNLFLIPYPDLLSDLKFATIKYKEYKACMNDRSTSKYSFNELESFIEEICKIERVLVSQGIFSLEELKIEEKKIEDNEENTDSHSDTSNIDFTYNEEIDMAGDMNNTTLTN